MKSGTNKLGSHVIPFCRLRVLCTVFLVFLSLVGKSSSFTVDDKSKRSGRIPTTPSGESKHGHDPFRRRLFLTSLAPILSSIGPKPCNAVGEGQERMVLTQKPTAPRGALIPALQQRILLEQCVSLSKTLVDSKDDRDETLEKLKTIISPLSDNNRPAFQKQPNLNLEPLPNQQYLQGNVVRVSMNLYTSNLRFQDDLPSYSVTDPAWKKNYIRQNDGLPDISKVLQADLDIRDLYRNSIVTELDDASAELYSNDVDVVELNQLLTQAAKEFDSWLGRIEDSEVKIELQAALEGKTPKIYKSYFAGFVPPK